MFKGAAYKAQKPSFGHAAVFDLDVVRRPLKAPSRRVVHSIAVTTANTAVHSSEFLSTPELNSVQSFRWRDANWGLIGCLLFGSLFWLAFFRFALPTLTSMLHFLFNRWAV
ncbi:MAG: hypothetical protein P4M15_11925 [Alphaproteobacteria bacterium]|nr:hypothetical protein [Alphaproteobacteria bacterium]